MLLESLLFIDVVDEAVLWFLPLFVLSEAVGTVVEVRVVDSEVTAVDVVVSLVVIDVD